MYHLSTTELLDYWRDLRGEALAPARARFEPAAVRRILSQVFMLGRQAPGDYRFRLAGGKVCDLHGGELRGKPFLSLWAEDDRLHIKTVLEAMRRTGEPVVVTIAAEAGTYAATIEMLLAPLTGASGEVDRVLGLYQPLTPVAGLTERPLTKLNIARIAKALTAIPEEPPKLRLASVSGRLVG